jgi:hypothetical protein
MSLLDKMMKSGSIKVELLSDSTFFNKKESVPTEVPIINMALSGTVDGGLVSGLTFLAGPSRHFKSLLGLIMIKAYMNKYKDAVCLFYDSEFGITPDYIRTNGIDTERVIHIPIEHLEQLKFDISKRLESIERGDKVIIFIDSVGNLASKKEVEDALDGKSVADMTRARVLKSLWRIVTPHLTTKDIPCIAVNHTYQTMEIYSKAVMSGGCVVAGTKMIMSNGNHKNIEDVKEGEMVKTLFGDKTIKHTWTPETLEDGEPECFEVKFEDGSTVTCSENHMFLIDNVWTKVKDLCVGVDLIEISSQNT